MNCNIIFGLDAEAFKENSDFLEHSLRMYHTTSYDKFRVAIYSIFPWLRYIYPNQFTSTEFTNWFIQLMDHAIEMRNEHNISRDDFLNFLITMKNKKNMSMDLIYAHAYTFFLDGYETTSYILGNAVNYLAENKNCQDKLRAEIKSHDNINLEGLLQLPYLDAVFNGIIINYYTKTKQFDNKMKKEEEIFFNFFDFFFILQKRLDSATFHFRYKNCAPKLLSLPISMANMYTSRKESKLFYLSMHFTGIQIFINIRMNSILNVFLKILALLNG